MNAELHAIIDADVRTEFSDDPEKFAIQLCDDHHGELIETLGMHATPDILLKISHGLSSLAAKTIGTQALVAARCPVCALREFPYVANFCKIFVGVAS
jgi:hypothetical protein